MVIALDIRPLSVGVRGGIPEFTKMLFDYLITYAPEHTYVLFGNALHFHPECTKLITTWSSYAHVTMCITRYPTKLFWVLLKFFRYPRIDTLIASKTGLHPDIIIACNFDFFSFSLSCSTLLIVHDLTFDLYSSFSSWKKRLKYKLINPKKTLSLFSHCMVNSSQTKRDVEKYYNYNPDRIITIPFGIPDSFLKGTHMVHYDDIKKKYPFITERYIFFIGSEEPRKNSLLLFDAYSQLILDTRFSHIQLCMSGKNSIKNSLMKKACEFGIQSRIQWVGELLEEEKYWLLKKAVVLVYPSFYEGFGFPPLEAASCKTPVISALHSSIGEVMGNACIMIDPYNSTSLLRALQEILSNNVLREQYCERGFQQAQKFPFSKTGAKILECIEKITCHKL